MTTIDEAITLIIEHDELIERSVAILGGAPYFTYVSEEEFAYLRIVGDTATLYWPEVHSGYYDSCSIETQSKSFPAKYLEMSMDEIKAWTAEEDKKYEREQAAKREQELALHKQRQTSLELQTLAMLKAKYEANNS